MIPVDGYYFNWNTLLVDLYLENKTNRSLRQQPVCNNTTTTAAASRIEGKHFSTAFFRYATEKWINVCRPKNSKNSQWPEAETPIRQNKLYNYIAEAWPRETEYTRLV